VIEEIKNASSDLAESEPGTKSEALVKAEIIKQNKPEYFVIFTPHRMQAFKVILAKKGFELLEAKLPVHMPETIPR